MQHSSKPNYEDIEYAVTDKWLVDHRQLLLELISVLMEIH